LFIRSRHAACFLAATLLLALFTAACSKPQQAPMEAVSDFAVERYLGDWFQIAAIPAWFQEDCVANTTASYAPAEGGRIAVINSCDTADGSRKSAEARARFTGSATEAKLEVTFVDLFGFWLWPAGGDYWVIGLDKDYRWAVIGQPSRSYAWVLAREPSLDVPDLDEISDILVQQGYDPCTLLLSMPDRERPLCDLAG
jgi:apolipoprotein D and lipocalin family protein